MPTIKQAQIPPPNLKDMINLSSAAPGTQPSQMPRPESIEARTGVNSLSIGPSPSVMQTPYDNIRQWIRPGAPQFRIPPLPPKTHQQFGAFIQSLISQAFAQQQKITPPPPDVQLFEVNSDGSFLGVGFVYGLP